MQRLSLERDRLYATPAGTDADQARALVLEVVQPTGWDALSPLWQGVQAELELPAPAIAVSGVDAIQLWFSLAAPVAEARAHEFLDALRQRFLPDVPPARVRLWPDPARRAPGPLRVPTLFTDTGNWSAFVAPDLIAVFSDTPWLDIQPGDDGQSALLRGLRSITPAQFDEALASLRADASARDARAPAPTAALAPARESIASPVTAEDDPRRFLLRVMNDERVDLALRIEAAKALLPR